MISALEHSVENFGLSLLLSQMTMEFRLVTYSLMITLSMNWLISIVELKKSNFGWSNSLYGCLASVGWTLGPVL